MIPGCMRIGKLLLAAVAGHASDGERLEIESHLAECARCRAEHGSWQLVRRVRGWDPPRLSDSARERVRQAMQTTPRVPVAAVSRRRWHLPAAGAALALCAALVIVSFGERLFDRHVVDGDVQLDGDRVTSLRGGRVVLGGPMVALAAGTEAVWRSTSRTVELKRGSVTVEVDPRQRKPFRVSTARFVVEVMGTVFTVDGDGVRTARGKVRVLGLDGRPLATVAAGEAWRVPPPPPPPVAKPAPVTSTTAAAPSSPVPASTPDRKTVSAPTRLAQARQALAKGDASDARVLVRPLFVGSRRQAAEARALFAESFLVEGRYADAMESYEAVVHDYADTPQAESALYAIAQLQLERHARDEAAHTLRQYLERYPGGRFAGEARDRLQRLGRAHSP